MCIRDRGSSWAGTVALRFLPRLVSFVSSRPVSYTHLLMRAYIYMQQRDYKMAKADYERLLKVNPTSYNGCLGLATLEQREGKYEEALKLLNTMIAAKGENRQLSPSQYAMLYVARAGVEKDLDVYKRQGKDILHARP